MRGDECREAFDERLQPRARRLVGEVSFGVEELAGAWDNHSSARPIRRSERAEYGQPCRLREERAVLSKCRAHDDDRLVAEHFRDISSWAREPVDRILGNAWNGVVVFGGR